MKTNPPAVSPAQERIQADEDEQPRKIPNSFSTKDSHTSTDIATRRQQSQIRLMLTESNRPVGQSTSSRDLGLATNEFFQRQKGGVRGDEQQRGHHRTNSLSVITRSEPPQQHLKMGRELIRQHRRSLVDDAIVSSNRQQRRHRLDHTPAPVIPPSSSVTAFFGNSDDSRYWDYAFRFVHRGDLGHRCRECKGPFLKLNEKLAIRR